MLAVALGLTAHANGAAPASQAPAAAPNAAVGEDAAPAVDAGGGPDAAAAAAADAALASQPYGTIVARNVFGLVPIPPPAPPAPPPTDPPPKITATGIMTIFGTLEVLFKVSMPAKAGQPAKDVDYTLAEGERQDDIEVVKIDEKAAMITFKNHDVVQDIALADGKASSSEAAPGPGGRAPNPFAPPGGGRFPVRPGGFPGGFPGGPGGFGRSPGATPSASSSPNLGGGLAGGIPTGNPTAGGGLNFNSSPNVVQPTQQTDNNLTPQQQMLLIEAERARLQSSSHPEYPPGLLPPTPMTPPEGGGTGQQ